MDYKRLIPSRKLRTRILQLFNFVPDSLMLRVQYKLKTGHKLHLKNPQRFTEKIQWYKLYYKNREMIRCVDKYDVRDYVKGKGLEHILIPCYGVYESFKDIEWDRLPDKFVLKDTLGGGGNSIVLVHNKNTMNQSDIRKTLESWTKENAHIKDQGREWPYYQGKNHRIIIENLLEVTDENKLIDYKFFCFYGKVACVYVICDRNIGNHGKLAIVDSSFHRILVQSTTQEKLEKLPPKPTNFHEMLQYASVLSKDFPHVRVDMYNVEGKIYFGELTFYGASGYQTYEPDEFDMELGSQMVLPEKRGQK